MENTDEQIKLEIESIIPDFAEMIKKAETENIQDILIHQDAFAADNELDELILLGKAIKYAGMSNINITIHGKNRETLTK